MNNNAWINKNKFIGEKKEGKKEQSVCTVVIFQENEIKKKKN